MFFYAIGWLTYYSRLVSRSGTSASDVKIPGLLAVSEGEVPVWYGRQTFKSFLGSIVFGFLLLALGLATLFFGTAFGLGFFAFMAIVDWVLVALYVTNSEYFVSNRRVFVKYGIIGRTSNDLKIEWISGTIVHQGLFGRVLNFGDLEFTGAGVSKVRLHGVSDVLMVKGIVEDTIQSNVDRAPIPVQMSYPSSPSYTPVPTAEAQLTSSQQYKFCQFCGSRMPSPAIFCPSCGKQQL